MSFGKRLRQFGRANDLPSSVPVGQPWEKFRGNSDALKRVGLRTTASGKSHALSVTIVFIVPRRGFTFQGRREDSDSPLQRWIVERSSPGTGVRAPNDCGGKKKGVESL